MNADREKGRCKRWDPDEPFRTRASVVCNNAVSTANLHASQFFFFLFRRCLSSHFIRGSVQLKRVLSVLLFLIDITNEYDKFTINIYTNWVRQPGKWMNAASEKQNEPAVIDACYTITHPLSHTHAQHLINRNWNRNNYPAAEN